MTQLRVLIVEHEPIVAHNLERVLGELGYAVFAVVASAEEAIQQVSEVRPDLVLMDSGLQDRADGIDAGRQIQTSFGIPVVYLGGYADDAALNRARVVKPLGHILKPFEMDQVHTAIEMALYMHSVERRLRESEQRCRIISELSTDLAYAARVEPDGTLAFEWTTPAVTRITGFEPDEIEELGGWMSLVLSEDLPQVHQHLEGLMSGRPDVQEARILAKDGEVRWLRGYARPEWDEAQGRVVRVYGAVQDITAHKQVEGALQQAHDELERRMVERTPELARVNMLLQQEIADHWVAQKALAERITQLALINEIGTQITGLLDLDSLLDRATHLVQECFGYHHVAVFILDREREDLVMTTRAGSYEALFPPEHRIPLSEGIVGWVACHGERLLANDVRRERNYINTLPARVDTRAELAVPIQIHGQTIGVFDVQSPNLNAFDENDVMVMETIAGQIAVAFQNAQLYRSVKQELAQREQAESTLHSHAERLEALRKIDKIILGARSPGAIAQATLQEIQHLVPCQYASVIVFEPQLRRATMLAVHADGEARFKAGSQVAFDINEMLAQSSQQETCVVTDLLVRLEDKACQPTGLERILLAEGIRSYVSIRLVVQREVIGLFSLGNNSHSVFGPDQVQIVEEVARPLAIGIHQARLHERLEHHAEGLGETVTQRTRELQAERNRTQAILEAVGESVIVTDTAGQILYSNPATTTLTGYSRTEMLGWSAQLQFSGQPSTELYPQIDGILRTGRTWHGELVARRKDGTLYDSAVSVTPLFDPDDPGRFIGSVWVQRDITAHKEAERLKDQFISNVSHELRTPLSIITLTADNMEAFYDRMGEDQHRQMLHSICDQVQVLNDLIGDVLEISRIDSGRISTERRPVDLARLIREEAEKQQPLAQEKAQCLKVACTESLAVWANDGQLRQVMRNLLQNAIKYTPREGEIICECLVQSGPVPIDRDEPENAADPVEDLSGGRWAVARVTDTGIGISQDNLHKIFERFHRIRPEENVPGTGLGLAIARELVVLHGGSITVSSVLGQGSTFTVFLPLLEEEEL